MNETINVNRNKLPPLSAMGTYEPAPKIDASALKGPQRAASALGGNTSPTNTGDPFYKQMHGMEAEKEVPMTATPRTQASNGIHDKKLVAKNPKNGLKMISTEKEVLEHIHEMRLKQFEVRANDPRNEKPYLPMLSSDEKELILEQYFASKKKLNKV